MIRATFLMLTASCILIWIGVFFHTMESKVYQRSYWCKCIDDQTTRHTTQNCIRKDTASSTLSSDTQHHSSPLNKTNDVSKRNAPILQPKQVLKIRPVVLRHSPPAENLSKSSKIQNASITEDKSNSHADIFVKDGIFFNKSMHGQHQYNYVHKNSDLCAWNKSHNDTVFLLIMCLTSPAETYRRAAIRKTWANVTHVLGRRVATIFLLANSSENLNEVIAHESEMFGDICKEDFIDSYQNLTLKTMMGFRWVNSFCNETKFVLKIDSDTIPNLHNIVRHLLEKRMNTTTFEGYVMKGKNPVRKNDTWIKKWYVPKSVYPHPTYPPYVNGPSYLVSSNLVNHLVSISEHIPYIPIEDVYVGMLMKTIGVRPTYNHRYTQHRMSLKSENTTLDALCTFSKAFTVFTLNPVKKVHEFWMFWNHFDRNECSNIFKMLPYY
ncbi:beta-1,3-galactosyltransferase 1-like [Amphiura filiformis]|uniref:beta-1,3-galactosyltransferase 1-like n=1 Tax=Amphiura filiformis TaxID=82378 RepID=UPI003B219AE4